MDSHNRIFKKMADYIEVMIKNGMFAPGSKIPSLRQLAKKFDLSIASARCGIEYLHQKGLVELTHGSGTYVRTNPISTQNNKNNIAVFITKRDLHLDFCGYVLNGVQKEAAEKNVVIMLNFSDYTDITYAELNASISSCEGLIMLGCYDCKLESIPACCPSVGVSMHNSYGGIMSSVNLDCMNAAFLAGKYFRERGQKRVKIITHSWPAYSFASMVCFDYLVNSGFGCEMVNQDTPKEGILDSHDCGYLFISSTEYEYFVERWLENHSFLPCEDYDILTLDGKSLLFPEFHPVSTIGTDWEMAGRLALQECLRRIHEPNSGSRRIYTDVFLHVDKTARRLQSAGAAAGL